MGFILGIGRGREGRERGGKEEERRREEGGGGGIGGNIQVVQRSWARGGDGGSAQGRQKGLGEKDEHCERRERAPGTEKEKGQEVVTERQQTDTRTHGLRL